MGRKRKKPTLDLHGTKHENVPVLIDRFLYENRKYSGPAIIITGKSYKMENIVLETLSRYSIEKMPSLDIFNTGHITIYV